MHHEIQTPSMKVQTYQPKAGKEHYPATQLKGRNFKSQRTESKEKRQQLEKHSISRGAILLQMSSFCF